MKFIGLHAAVFAHVMQKDDSQQGILADPHRLRVTGHHQGMIQIRDHDIGKFLLIPELALMLLPGIIQGFVGLAQVLHFCNGFQTREHMRI